MLRHIFIGATSLCGAAGHPDDSPISYFEPTGDAVFKQMCGECQGINSAAQMSGLSPTPQWRSGAGSSRFCVWTASGVKTEIDTFADVSASLVGALGRLGYSVEAVSGAAVPQGRGRVIALGINTFRRTTAAPLPNDCIIVQLEHAGSPWFGGGSYLETLKRHTVWDFARRNVEFLQRSGCSRVSLVRIGYARELERPVAGVAKDIDVLFFGSMNKRRRDVLDRLRALGLRVHDQGAWGAELDRLVARSRVVLNMHYYDDAALEMVRVSYLLANKAAVVAERGLDPELEAPLAGGVVFAAYGDLAQACADLVRGGDQGIGARGYAALCAVPFEAEVARALAEARVPSARGPATEFRAACARVHAAFFGPHKADQWAAIDEFLQAKLEPRIPVFVNNCNRLTWTRDICEQIVRLGGEPIIVDNASTYPPLLAWYADCPYNVVHCKNLGPRAPWISDTVAKTVRDGSLYAVTDPDLDLSGVPDDCFARLEAGLRHGVAKSALSLELNDVPVAQLEKLHNGRRLRDIEGAYWRQPLGDGFYRADTDTTFALYRRGSEGPMLDGSRATPRFFSAVRADRPYTARHIPWYQTDLDDEDRFYIENRMHIEQLGATY
jgi:hypothetical protein